MLELRSSWTVDQFGVRPLGAVSRRKGDLSPRRQKIRERIALTGRTTLDDARRLRRMP